MSNFKSNQNTFSIPCSIDYFRFGPGIGWYRYQVIGNRPSLINTLLGRIILVTFAKKISKPVGIIYRSCFYLSTKTKLSLHYTLIYPYITYCNIAWSSTYVTNVNRIFYLQKRAVRALTNYNFRAMQSTPLFSQLGILDILKVNSLHIAQFMFC